MKFYKIKNFSIAENFVYKNFVHRRSGKLSCSPNQISINPTPEKNGMSLEIHILLNSQCVNQK